MKANTTLLMSSVLLLLLLLHGGLIEGKRRGKRTDVEFNSDADVSKYLQRKGKDIAIFKCKKVVMVQWLHSVIPYVDLQCEVLGDVSEVMWYVNETLIGTAGSGGRFISISQPHYKKRTFHNNWFDYKLRMLQVTEKDNGLYTMKIKSPKGGSDQGDIMLEVMTEYKEEKWFEWMSRVKNDSKIRKNKKRSAAKMAKRRKKELLRKVRKRAQERRGNARNQHLIFEGQ